MGLKDIRSIYAVISPDNPPKYIIACNLVEVWLRFLLVMVALCNRADHYIFAVWFLSSIFYLSFFPRLISAAAGWMSTILLHMAWP